MRLYKLYKIFYRQKIWQSIKIKCLMSRHYYRYNGVKGTYSCIGQNPEKFIYYEAYKKGISSGGELIGDINYDIAFVVWSKSIVSKTGCLGATSDVKVNDTVNTLGYPGDLKSGLRLYRATGTVSSVSDLRLSYVGFSTAGGQSGSPLYNDAYFAFGVHTHSGPSGRRIDYGVLSWLQSNGYI